MQLQYAMTIITIQIVCKLFLLALTKFWAERFNVYMY